MRLATIGKIVVVVAAALVATSIAALMSLDFSRYKGELVSYVERATGRTLTIDGEFHLRIGLTPTLSVERVRFANAAWGSRPEMASIERFSAEVRLLPLIFGEIRVERLILEGAAILLESDAEGRPNWEFAPPPAADMAGEAGERAVPILPSFGRVRIERARIVWRDGKAGKADEVTINSLEAQASSPSSPVAFALRALYGGVPLAFSGSVGPLAQLAKPAEPWPFDVTAEAGGATLTARGTMRAPLALSGVEAMLSAEGADLSTLGQLAGRALPRLGPWRVTAQLADEGAIWTVGNLDLSVGGSAIAGNAALDISAQPPRLRATVTAPLLDLADLSPRAAPPAAPASRAAAIPAPRPRADGRLFGDAPLPLDWLDRIDAQLGLRVARLLVGGVPLADLAAELRIENGMFTARPVSAALAGSPLAAELRLARDDSGAAALGLQLDVQKLDIAALLKESGQPALAAGKIDISATAEGTGASMRALMAALSGNAEITMGRGTIADGTLDMLSADVIKAISPWAPPQRDLRVNCMVGRYDIRSGMLTSQATLFDSDRVMLTGEGGVNLATEQIGFTVVPHAKEASLLQLAVPIRIGGTLLAPVAFPDAERMAKGAVGFVAGLPGAVGGAVVGTVGSLLGGPGAGAGADDNPCVALLRGGAGERRRPATASSDAPSRARPADPVEGIGKAIEGIGRNIGEGLRNLFGQ